MGFDVFLLIVIFLIIPAIIIAYVARVMGYSATVWLIFSLFLTWPIALISLLVLNDFAKVIVRRMRSKPGQASANIPEMETSIRFPQGPGTEGVEVYLFNGKEYPARDIAENARDLYIADLRPRFASD